MFQQFFLKEKNIMIAIVINAIIIFLLYFPEVEANFNSFYHFLESFDHFFVCIFAVEAIVKIRYMGRKKYFADAWNKFDFLIVVLSIPSLMYFIPEVSVLDTSVLKIFRLLRLIRLIRFIRFIPHVEMILAGLGRALRASVFVFIVLIFLNFLLALVTCHFYGKLVPEYFGNPLISSYYIFQMFTVEGWNEIPSVIAAAAKEKDMEYSSLIIGISRFYFIIIVLVGGILGMSLANAIFVDEMTIDNNQILESKIDHLEQEIQELKALIRNQSNREGGPEKRRQPPNT